MKKNKHQSLISYGIVLAVWVLYVFLTYHGREASGSDRYDLTEFEINILRLTILIPYLLIWLSSWYGATKLKAYSESILDSQDGRALKTISHGLFVLFGGLIISPFISVFRNYRGTPEDFYPHFTILLNYSYVVVSLMAFWFIYHGSKKLLSLLGTKKLSVNKLVASFVPLVLFIGCYIWLIFTNVNRQGTAGTDAPSTFYLSDIMIVATIIIPSIISWVLGVLAILNLDAYTEGAKGSLYKQALPPLTRGILAVISGSILLHALLSFGSSRLGDLGLGAILLIVYVFLLIQAVGYLLIAVGSKRLAKFETV